jgi:hypothetical protein
LPEQFPGKICPLNPDMNSPDRTASRKTDLSTDTRGDSFDKWPILMGQIASKVRDGEKIDDHHDAEVNRVDPEADGDGRQKRSENDDRSPRLNEHADDQKRQVHMAEKDPR